MFMAFLSMTLYKRVICHLLVSGPHMCPDRVVSDVKKSFGVADLFHPSQMNSIKSVDVVWRGWDTVLKEHMKAIPNVKDGGYKKIISSNLQMVRWWHGIL
jgi:hypothetical protein